MNHLLHLLGESCINHTDISTTQISGINLVSGNDKTGMTKLMQSINKAVSLRDQKTYMVDDREVDVLGLSDCWYYIECHPQMIEAALDLLKTTYPSIEAIFINDDDCEMYVSMEGEEHAVSLHDMSMDYAKLLTAIVGSCVINNGIVLIDDVLELPEHAIEPFWVFVTQMAYSQNNQVFVASTNPDVVAAFSKRVNERAGFSNIIISTTK